MTLRGDCVAKKLNLVDMYGIGVMLEYLVAEDNLYRKSWMRFPQIVLRLENMRSIAHSSL